MKVLNNNVIIKINDTVTLRNGINLKETRGKRDIVTATVILSDAATGLTAGSTVWFPLYASNEIIIDGQVHAVVSFDDIIMIKE